MSTRAQKLGARGVIIDGNFRDVNEHRDLGFPVSFFSMHIIFKLGSNQHIVVRQRNLDSRFGYFYKIINSK